MITPDVSTASYELLNFPVKIIRLTAIVLTEVDIHLVELDAELTEIETRH